MGGKRGRQISGRILSEPMPPRPLLLFARKRDRTLAPGKSRRAGGEAASRSTTEHAALQPRHAVGRDRLASGPLQPCDSGLWQPRCTPRRPAPDCEAARKQAVAVVQAQRQPHTQDAARRQPRVQWPQARAHDAAPLHRALLPRRADGHGSRPPPVRLLPAPGLPALLARVERSAPAPRAVDGRGGRRRAAL